MKIGMPVQALESIPKSAEISLFDDHAILLVLMENISDHIYFKDTASCFIRVNPALARRLGLQSSADAIGKTDADFFTEEHASQAYIDEQRIMQSGFPLENIEEKETWPDGSVHWVSTTKLPLRDTAGKIIGTCGISRDITARKQIEVEREMLIRNLRSAIEQIKTLKGLVPMCSGCKKIRDDHGYWEKVESYLSRHADIEFTHGLCPDCLKSIYPEYSGDEKNS